MGLTSLSLTACAPAVPDSGAGVGFSEYSQYEIERARREAALGSSTPLSAPVGGIGALGAPVTTVPSSGIGSSDLAAAGIGTSAFGAPSSVAAAPLAPPVSVSGQIASAPVTGTDALRTEGVQASPSNAPLSIASTGISNEQDFETVSGERDIQGDAALRAQQQAAYQVVQPTALPTRAEEVGPNIVQYALAAPNRRGQEWYSRSILAINAQGKFERNCAEYRSPDEAQRDFLARGGPERDSRGIDPDGDGFACGWDPAPFLLVSQ